MHAPYEHLKLYLGHLILLQSSSVSSVLLGQSALPSQTNSSDMQDPSAVHENSNELHAARDDSMT